MSPEARDERLRVALVIDSLGSGGAQRQLVELAAALARRSHVTPRVFTYHPHDFFAGRLSSARVPWTVVPRRGRLDPLLPLRLARAFREQEVSVVHAFLLLPAFWTLLAVRLMGGARPRLIAAERSSVKSAPRSHAALQHLVFRTSDAITVNAQHEAEEIHARFATPRARIHYVANGIDLAAWDEAGDADCPLPLEPDRFQVALIGGLRPEKNHALLFRALALVPAAERSLWRVWCIGGETAGPGAAEEVRKQLRASGLDSVVRITGAISNVAPLIRRLDAVVLTSTFEGFPNVLLEAHASRVPVISTRVGDAPSLVAEGRTGRIVDSRPEAFAQALRELASMPRDLRRAWGQRGREVVEARFAMDSIAAMYERLYATVAPSSR